MCCKNNEEDIYNETIDSSKEMSVQKAIAIFLEEQEKNKPIIKRPEINPTRGIIKILTVLIFFGALGIASCFYKISLLYVFLLFFVIVVVTAKKTVIWMILLYQKYAPEEVRRACVFEPTCSNYMLMAIDKYGLVKGVIKGLKRLSRCHYPNGGIDNP